MRSAWHRAAATARNIGALLMQPSWARGAALACLLGLPAAAHAHSASTAYLHVEQAAEHQAAQHQAAQHHAALDAAHGAAQRSHDASQGTERGVDRSEHGVDRAEQGVERQPSRATLTWRVALRDLDAQLDLDANADGQLTWAEVADRSADIERMTTASVQLTGARAQSCALAFAPLQYQQLDDTGFAHISARVDCGGAPVARVAYRFAEGLDPSHRALLTTAGVPAPRLLAPGDSAVVAASDAATDEPANTGFNAMLVDGIGHILGGPDHLLFLVALLLPAVLVRSAGTLTRAAGQPRASTDAGAVWRARDDLRPALAQVAWMATAFTLAHSITLGLASFHLVRVPSSIIEPLIAATVLVTALNNLKPVVTTRLAACAFAFGLIHGFGFAEVLAPLSLPPRELAVALLAFNLGVEAGQLIIITIAFTLLAALRRWRGYPRWVLGGGSVALVVIAVAWIVERVFDVPVFEPMLSLAAATGA